MKFENIVIGLIIIVLFSLVLYKGINVSMTHDESASYIYLKDQRVIDDLFQKDVWSNANNHWLNTLSFKFFTKIFGPEPWAIRMFSMFSFLVYGFAIYMLGLRIGDISLRFAFTFFCLANPYLLDFFSTARGYGISIGFTTLALWLGILFTEKNKVFYLWSLSLCLIISTLSLFSSIIYFPAIFLSILLSIYFNAEFEFKKHYSTLAIMGISSLIILFLTYIPLTQLSKSDEFRWGDPSLIGSFKSLADLSSYSKKYMPESGFIVGFTAFSLIFILYRFIIQIKAKKNTIFSKQLIFSGIIFLSILATMIFARNAFETFYPNERKTTMYVPLLGLVIFYFLDITSLKNTKVKFILPLIICIHFIASFNPKVIREWWYDSDTKNMISLVFSDSKGEEASIASHWMFWPALKFYSTTKFDNLEIAPYNKDIDSTNSYNYYIIFDSDLHLLKNKYNVVYKNISGFHVLRHK